MQLLLRALAALREDSARLTLAIAVMAGLLLASLDLFRSPLAFVALLPLPLAFILRRRPYWAAACLIGAASVLRLFWWEATTGADQIVVAQGAFERVLSGLSPYGVNYPTPALPGAPYPYGPWGWLWWAGGAAIEYVAFVGIMGVLAWRRAWLTLAILGAWTPAMIMTTSGVNDFSPTFFLVLGLAIAESHPRWAAVSLALATGLKLQAFAWVPGFVVYLPRGARVLLLTLIALLWLPLLFWGPDTLLRSVLMVGDMHQEANGMALDMPWLRVALLPALYFALRARTARTVGVSGGAIFFLVLFTGAWGSMAYWIPLIAMVGLTMEMALGRNGSSAAGSCQGPQLAEGGRHE